MTVTPVIRRFVLLGPNDGVVDEHVVLRVRSLRAACIEARSTCRLRGWNPWRATLLVNGERVLFHIVGGGR